MEESVETLLATAGLRVRGRTGVASACGAAGAAAEAEGADRLPEPLCDPLELSSVSCFRDLDQLAQIWTDRAPAHVYRRMGHPNQLTLERTVARLEGAEEALACSSGMGAIYLALAAHVSPGDTLIAQEGLYGGTRTLLSGIMKDRGVRLVLVPEASEACVARALGAGHAASGRPRVVLVETIANPSLAVADLPALGRLAAEHDLLLVVDNTFATPLGCRPLRWGRALVVESATKYLSGHSDVLGGILAGPADLVAPARTLASAVGLAMGPLEAWLTLRGLRTLHLRWERHETNARRVAEWLAAHPAVDVVAYPGLPSHPGHAMARHVLQGFGGIVSFRLVGGEPAARRFVSRLTRIPLAPSLGETATTITYPALTSHRGQGASDLEAVGAGPGVIRLSAGLEHAADILADLERALTPPPGEQG